MTPTDRRFWLGVAGPTIGVILAGLALMAYWNPALPAVVAQQWDWTSGAVKTVGPLWTNILVLPGAATAMLGVLAVMKWSGKLTVRNRRALVAILTGSAFSLACAAPVLLYSQVGLTDPMLAPEPRAEVLVLGIVSIAYGILCTILLGRESLESDATAGFGN